MKGIWKKILMKLVAIAIELLKESLEDKEVKPLALVDSQAEFLQDASKLIQFANSLPDYKVTGGELFRTEEQQAIYVSKGLSKTMSSKHRDRLAIDINVFINGVYRRDRDAYKPLSEFWKSLSPKNRSGYDWGWDANHFEKQP